MASEAGVLAYGMACPLGLSAEAALAAMYAGINRFSESDFVLDAGGEPARGSMLRRLDPGMSRTERAAFFARRAFAAIVAPLAGSGSAEIPCFLATSGRGIGPEIDVGQVQRELVEVVRAAGGKFACAFQLLRSGASGRAGVFVALQAALAALEREECSVAVVGGLDCCVDRLTLRALVDANRLLSVRNPDGFLPGEGAAFVVLMKAGGRSVGRPLACVTDCALARETHPRGRGGPDVADGLTAAFEALRRRRTEPVDVVISAQTGEAAYARAFSYAYLRNAALMPEPLRLVTLGESLGDTGAAAGAIGLVAAVAGLQPGPVVGRPPRYASALVYGASDDGTVGGCIITPVRQGRIA